MSNIQIFPYSTNANGSSVTFIKDGILQTRQFPKGTTDKEILAAIYGNPIQRPDPSIAAAREAAKKLEDLKKQGAPPATTTEEQSRKNDAGADKKILERSKMIDALRKHGVKAPQLLKDVQLLEKYNKICGGKE